MCVALCCHRSLKTRAHARLESAQTNNVLKEKEEKKKEKKEKRTGPFCRDCAAMAGHSLKTRQTLRNRAVQKRSGNMVLGS